MTDKVNQRDDMAQVASDQTPGDGGASTPELNPVEQVWARSKYADLANYIPADIEELGRAVRASLRRTSGQQMLLRSFFQHAKLKL